MNNTKNVIAVSNRGLLITCTTISILSFFGILFLLVVVALVVSKAVQLAENYRNIKNEVQDISQNFVESDNFKNFRNHLVDATKNALTSTQRIVKKRPENEEGQTDMISPYNY